MLSTLCVVCSGPIRYAYVADLSMSDVTAGMMKC